jgi:hypothetical protein
MGKLINEVIKVQSCWGCPFFEYQDEMMDLSCHVADEGFAFDKKAENAFHRNYDAPYLHPECPLRKGKILVELKRE